MIIVLATTAAAAPDLTCAFTNSETTDQAFLTLDQTKRYDLFMMATFYEKINKIIKLITLQQTLQQTSLYYKRKQTFLSVPSWFIFTALP
jgi:hypothetical protein